MLLIFCRNLKVKRENMFYTRALVIKGNFGSFAILNFNKYYKSFYRAVTLLSIGEVKTYVPRATFFVIDF